MNGSAIFRIIVGIALIIGGMTGKLVLIGTHSGTAAAWLGAGIVALGLFSIRRRTPNP